MTALRPPAILALTPGTLTAGAMAPFDELERAVGRAVAGGLTGVLVREPGLPDRPFTELVRRVAAGLAEAPEGGWLGVHDRPHLATALAASGVHLGWRSLPPERVRALLGPDVAIGASTHAGDPAPDPDATTYAFLGPVRATPSKEGLLEPLGFEAFAAAARASRVPLWAIGGLGPENAGLARASGAAGLAVRAGILASADPAERARRYRAAWDAEGGA